MYDLFIICRLLSYYLLLYFQSSLLTFVGAIWTDCFYFVSYVLAPQISLALKSLLYSTITFLSS